jgi:hypothetical protein
MQNCGFDHLTRSNGIRCAAYETTFYKKDKLSLVADKRRSFGRYSSLADKGQKATGFSLVLDNLIATPPTKIYITVTTRTIETQFG